MTECRPKYCNPSYIQNRCRTTALVEPRSKETDLPLVGPTLALGIVGVAVSRTRPDELTSLVARWHRGIPRDPMSRMAERGFDGKRRDELGMTDCLTNGRATATGDAALGTCRALGPPARLP